LSYPPLYATLPSQRRDNLSILAVTAFLRGAHNSIYGVVWQPFVLSLGASIPTLGLLNSLGGMGGIVTTLVQPLGGWFADRIGRKPFIIVSSIATLAGYALLAIAGVLNIWTLLILGVIFLGTSALANPARNSMTAESVRAERHASAFSLIIVASMVPGIVMPPLGGWVTDRFGFISIFPIMLALETIALFLVWRYLSETQESRGAINWREAGRALALSIVPPKNLIGIFCTSACDSFFWAMVY